MGKSIEAFIKPELLLWARQSARLPVADVAARLKAHGVTPQRLVDWESGLDRPSISQLRALAKIYKRPLAVFYLPAPPKDFDALHDYRRIFGIREEESPQLAYEIRKAYAKREIALELANNLEIPVPDFSQQIDLRDDPEEIGTTIRQLLNVDLDQQEHWATPYDALRIWKESIESLGILVFQSTKVPVEVMRGFSISQKLFPVIVLNGSDHPHGRIFTLLHELTHIMHQSGGICDFNLEDRTEVYCNMVAGATLVPGDDILDQPLVRGRGIQWKWTDDELGELSRKYKVSLEVVLRRLLTLELTTDVYYDSFRRRQLEKFRDMEVKPKKGFVEPYRKPILASGKTFVRIVLDAFGREIITSSDVSEFLDVKMKHLSDIEREVTV